jgi:hypothetical protein
MRDLDLSNHELSQRFIDSIQPTAFQSTESFIAVVVPLISRYFGLDRSNYRVSKEGLKEIKEYLTETFSPMDPILLQSILQHLASQLKAPPSLMSLFQVDMPSDSQTQGLARITHVWSKVFAELKTLEQFQLLQFLRGRSSGLSIELRTPLRTAFAQNGIFLAPNEVEAYIKGRITSLSPQARVALFHMALSQPNGVLSRPELRTAMYCEILESFEDAQTREIFLDLWEAGIESLPESLRKIVLSTAFSESGGSGSPEQALVTLFANMGPLVQKLGQSLAFEPNLPESFRTELEKLWDEAQKLEWWQAWELIRYQHGDLEKSGYILSRILNAGTTEASLEIIRVATGEKFVISVYRDGIKASVATDTSDLRKFAINLLAKNPKRYGFLQLLVEDNIATIQMELDRNHKRSASVEMQKIYEDTIRSLGGTVTNGKMSWMGLNFYSPKYVRIELADGKSTYGQELANGIPFKKLKEINFEEYKRVSEILIRLENSAQKRGEYIDKDRMPGQYLYDLESKTVSILDHGQAMKIEDVIHRNFERFIGKVFVGDFSGAFDLYSEMVGLEVSSSDRRTFAFDIRGVDQGLRPFQILHLLSEQALKLPDNDLRRIRFLELTHAVRAKMRLAHWAASLEITTIEEDLTASARQEISFGYLLKHVKSYASSALAMVENYFHTTESQVVPVEAMAPEAKAKSDIERMHRPFTPKVVSPKVVSPDVVSANVISLVPKANLETGSYRSSHGNCSQLLSSGHK